MKNARLTEKLAAAIGVKAISSTEELAGLFNRYRPNGAQLDGIFSHEGVEGEVLARLKRIFKVTAPGWDPRDLYFTVRQFLPLADASATELASEYLAAFKAFAAHVGDDELAEALDCVSIEVTAPVPPQQDDDLPAMMYDCVTDFLAELRPDADAVFLLKEALYSMANDYFLMAYVLRPAMDLPGKAGEVFDRYFDIWCRAIDLAFYEDGVAVVVNK
jgi:hypothetical protein